MAFGKIRLPWGCSIVLFLFTILGILLIPKQDYSCSAYNDVCSISYRNKFFPPPIDDYKFKKSDILQYKIVTEQSCHSGRYNNSECRDVYSIDIYLKSGKVLHLNHKYNDPNKVQDVYNKITTSNEFLIEDYFFVPGF